MRIREKIGHYAGVARGMREYLRTPLLENPKSLIRKNLQNREANWLRTLRQGVFESGGSAYRRMFEIADCDYADVERAVLTTGLEPTLRSLYEAGVYLTHDEFKGHQPAVRNGIEIPTSPGSFSNPIERGWLRMSSGGSRSAGTISSNSTAHLIHLTAYAALNSEEFDFSRGPYVIVRPTLPSIAGIYFCLFHSRLACRMGPWFAYGGSASDSLHYRALTRYIVEQARWNGCAAPRPSYLPQNDFSPVADYLAERTARGDRCVLQTVASTAVRIAAAAGERNLDISGTLVLPGGEPLTAAKRHAVEAVGMAPHPSYWVSEIGQIGHSCSQMRSGNRVHVFKDAVALIEHSQPAPFSEQIVNALLFTSLAPHAPNILINAEMQDSGRLTKSSCNCVYSRMGYDVELCEIASYGKLTGHGMTLVGTDVVRILEQRMPARFGGSPADYQLVEKDGGRGVELILRISPHLGAKPSDAREFFLQELRKCEGGALASRVWAHSEAVTVVSGYPLLTPAGKLMPLHLSRSATSTEN